MHFLRGKQNKLWWCLSITWSPQKKVMFSFFMFSFPCFTPEERGRLWIFLSSLDGHSTMSSSPPPPSSPFNLPYLIRHYLLNLAKRCVITYSESPMIKAFIPLSAATYIFLSFLQSILSTRSFPLHQSARVPFPTPMSASSPWAQSSFPPTSTPTYTVWAIKCFRKLSFSKRFFFLLWSLSFLFLSPALSLVFTTTCTFHATEELSHSASIWNNFLQKLAIHSLLLSFPAF